MERKKLLRSVVAVLCAVSMVFGYFVEIMPALKAQAAETETLPTDFNEVTPREFGISDFTGNTEKTVYKSSLKPLQSPDKMLFKANVVFGEGSFHIFDSTGKDVASKGIQIYPQWNNRLRIYAPTSFPYVGGRFQDGEYVDGEYTGNRYIDVYPLTGSGQYKTTSFSIAITVEVVNFDEGTSANDLKVGFWFDGNLYDNTYVYYRNLEFETKHMFFQSNTEEMTSPAITAKSQWDGYKIVTPSTFGIKDYETTVLTEVHQTEALGNGEYETFNIDGVVFNGKVDLVVNGASTYINYLYNTNGDSELEIERNSSTAAMWIYNRFAGKKMYIGGEFTDSETYVDTAGLSTTNPIEYDDKMILTPALAGLSDTKYGFQTQEYLLSISTDLIDFDKDEKKDDLRLGIWFNGVLYQNCYFYVVDYGNSVCQRRLYTKGILKSTSFNMEPDDLGLVSGEYAASDDLVIGTSEVATTKVMDGTTLETDITFNGVGASLLYGCDAEDTTKAFKLTSTADGIKVSHTYNGTEEQIGVLTKDLLGADLVNNKFHLKLTTSVVNIDGGETANDVLLGIQVNNKKCGYFATNVATQLTGRTGVECTGDAKLIVGNYASDIVQEVYHCLDESNYVISVADGVTRLVLDGNVPTEDTVTLNEPGTYSTVSTKNRLIYRETVVLYKRYDVDGNHIVDVRDIVRMLKVADPETQDATLAGLSKAGKLAMGYEGADTWTNDNAVHVVDFIRENIAGTKAEAKKTGIVTMMNRDQLNKFENKHGAFTGNFTFTLDLKDIDRVDEDFDDETDEIWILSTKAKYISMDESYPTITFKLLNKSGAQLYTSHSYKVGEQNAYVERQWRVPMTLADYTTLQVNFVVPDGVALYIDTIEDLDNVVGEISAEDETVYAEDNGVKYLAHSGFLQYAPDNTALSFHAAGKMGFKSLITIPKFTADGVAVCIHDDEIYKTNLRYTGGGKITSSDPNYSRTIQSFNYSELAQFDAGIYKGSAFSGPIPTLEEYFDICMEYRMAPVFSLHPALTVAQWQYVKNMLKQEKYMVDGHYWLLERLQIKAGDGSMLNPAIEVMGFDIGGYIIIQTSSWGMENVEHVLQMNQVAEKVQAAGYNFFDKVSVEFFDYSNHATQTVEDKIRLAKEFGFTRISLAPNGYADEPGFSSEKQRYFIALGVNSFTVDYHCSMGLNW